MIKEFIWDFDGMLFDTYPHTIEAFCTVMKRHGRIIDRDEALSLFKITMLHAFDVYGVDDKLRSEFYEVENDIGFAPCGKPYRGIPEILRYIKDSGARNYLYTHRDKVAVRYLDKYGLTGLFSDFVLRENGFPSKPAPDAIEYLVNKHGLDKKQCIMLGDRSIDIGSGQNAGISTCLFDEEGNLGDVSTSYYCRTIRDVGETVRKIL